MLTLLAALCLPARAAVVDFDRLSTRDFVELMQAVPAPAPVRSVGASPRVVYESDGSFMTPDELARRLNRARVVYAAEQHDQAAHHDVQLKLLTALHARKPDLAVGLEMVSKDLQAGDSALADHFWLLPKD